MFSLSSLFLGFALAMDAGVVAFALGLLSHEANHDRKWPRGLLIALLFGLSQFLMLWLGSYGGFLFSFSHYGHLFQFVVAGVFWLIGIKFLQDALEKEPKKLEWGWPSLLMLSFATSIDALAAGISLGTLPKAYLVALEIGIITFLFSGFFYLLSQFLHKLPDQWLLLFASSVFFVLGGRIFWFYFF